MTRPGTVGAACKVSYLCRTRRPSVRLLPVSMDSQPKAAGHLKVVRDAHRRPAELATVAYLGDDQAFLRALRNRDRAATAALFDAHQASVQKVLARVLGVDAELGDLLQEVFVRALRGVHTVRDGRVIQQWLRQIAVCTAMDCLRRRRRRRWLKFVAPEQIEEPATVTVNFEAREALRRVYRILDDFPDEERLVFTLRFFCGMELTEVAATSKCSLATAKRRLARVERRFVEMARNHPTLSQWFEQGNRWGRS